MKAFKPLPLIMLFLLMAGFSYAQKTKPGNNIPNISAIYNLYLDVKNALINDDGTTAKIKANELHYLLTTQPDKGLNWRQCKILADNLGPLIEDSRQIGLTISENEQRPFFANMSIVLYTLLKGLKTNTSIIYMMYCPKNKAYWLSETPVIKNPYYNYKEWATTGKTTEILAASR